MSFIFRPQIIPSWIDQGNSNRDSFWLLQNRVETVPSDLLAVVTAAKALTKSGRLCVAYQIPHVYGESGSSNVYGIGDAATFYVSSTPGGRGVISIPDLDPAILMPDGVTIDQSNSAVVAFVAQMYAKLGDSNGNAWTSIRAANRTRFPG